MDQTQMSSFLSNVYQLVLRGRSRKALTRIYDTLDDLVLTEQFQEVDEALSMVDLKRLDPMCMLGFLAITFPARNRLNEWENLHFRARQTCIDRGMGEDKIKRLFRGIR